MESEPKLGPAGAVQIAYRSHIRCKEQSMRRAATTVTPVVPVAAAAVTEPVSLIANLHRTRWALRDRSLTRTG